MALVKEGLYYSKSHEWVEVEGDSARIGISDFAQNELGDLVFAEAGPVGKVVSAGQVIGVVESVKMASDLFSPISGEIIANRPDLGDQPEMINSDPYGVWFVTIRMSNPAELDALMDAPAYEAFCQTEG